MDPNLVTAQIIEKSFISQITPFIIGFGGVILGALLSWLMMRWQIKKTLEMQKNNEKIELQNLYRIIKTGVTGYQKFMGKTANNIRMADNNKPVFFYTDPVSHRLPGYEEVLHLIVKIPNEQLLEAVMATNYSICDFGSSLQIHNNWFMEYEKSRQNAEKTKNEFDIREAELLLQKMSQSTNFVKKRYQVVEDNIAYLMKLLKSHLNN